MSSVLGRKRYDAQFKRDAVRLVLEGKRSCRAVEADLGLGTGVLYRWVRQYRAEPQQSFPGNGRLRPNDEQIRQLLDSAGIDPHKHRPMCHVSFHALRRCRSVRPQAPGWLKQRCVGELSLMMHPVSDGADRHRAHGCLHGTLAAQVHHRHRTHVMYFLRQASVCWSASIERCAGLRVLASEGVKP
jgi:transposase-like protein